MAGDTRRAVLITRPEPGANETAALIRALGLEPVLAPLMRVKLLAMRLPSPGTIQAILATSANAIAGLAATPANELDRSHPLLAVGDATAERARAAGFTATESASGNAKDLTALTCRRLQPGGAPLLLACGRGHGLPLAEALRQQGFKVLRRLAYATVPLQTLPELAIDALRADKLRAALFFSAETAHLFVSLTRRAGLENSVRNVAALAISPPAGVALSALQWGDLSIAARPNQDELLALLK